MGEWRGRVSWSASPLTTKNMAKQRFGVTVVGDHDVGADAKETLAFPFIESTRTVMGLIARHGDGEAADLLGVLDFHVTVAEGQQLRPADLVLAQKTINHPLFREGLVIIDGAVDVLAEVAREIEQLGFLLDEHFVGAAGQVESEPAGLKLSQELAGTMDEKGIRTQHPGAETVNAGTDAVLEAPQVFVLVPKRLLGRSAAFLDPRRQLDHLVNSLFSVETHDVVLAKAPAFLFGLGRERGKHLHEHGHHHLRPTFTEEGKRAVEIEQDVREIRARREAGREFDQAAEARDSLHVPPR